MIYSYDKLMKFINDGWQLDAEIQMEEIHGPAGRVASVSTGTIYKLKKGDESIYVDAKLAEQCIYKELKEGMRQQTAADKPDSPLAGSW